MKNSLLVFFAVLLLFSCKETQNIFKENSKDWNAHGDASWNFSNNELTGKVTDGAGFVTTKKLYTDFILELEFKPDSTINSGVFIRCKTEAINPTDCYEINIWDLHPNQNNRTGALVTRSIPLAHLETIGKWNTYKIRVEKNHLQVWLNDQLTIDTIDDDLPNGYLGLQAKGTGEIIFRNIEIKTIK